jgi:WD40 repeat protein
MRLVTWVVLVALQIAAATPAPARAQGLSKIETDDLRLLYRDPSQAYLVPHAARCFENSMRFQRRLFDYVPSQKVTVLLNDYSDEGNAGTTAVPRNEMLVEIAPINFAFETVTPNERVNWLMNHEMVHVVTVDKAARPDRFFRTIFGGKVMPVAEDPESIFDYFLTSPRDAAPRWYHEGIAVFIETWMAGGMGRAQGPYDEMVFRSMVLDKSHFYDPLGLVSEGTKIDFQVEVNSYLYGTRFMSYIADRHSPEKLIEWVSRSDGSKAYYSSQFRQVFDQKLEDAWRDWINWEKEFQQKNLEAIRKYPVTPYHDISQRALGSVSRAYYDPDSQKIYAAFNYPGVVAHVGAISAVNGSVEKLLDVKGPTLYTVTSLTFDPQKKTIFYTTDNNEYRDLRSLDPATRKSHTLMKDARIGDLAFNQADGSIWGLRHFNGIVTLVRVPPPYTKWNQVHSWDYGEVAYDLDVSPDGRLLSASVGEINGKHALQIFRTEDLLAGKVVPIAHFDFGDSLPLNFLFSPDGKYVYGSSYYTGVSNIYRYEIETGKLEALSNSETGFFRPIPQPDGKLIVFRYTGEGFVPTTIEAKPTEDLGAITFLGAQIVEKYPELKKWNVGSPANVPLDSMITSKGKYGLWGNIGLESAYPVVMGYKDSVAYGYRVNLSDPLSLTRINLTASYSPDHGLPSDERMHAQFEYQRYDWRARAAYNAADFYDLFGPTKTSRRGYVFGLGYDKLLLYDQPRKLTLSLDGTFYGNLDRLPDYQNVVATFHELFTVRAKLKYSNLRSSLGHVDDEKGQAWQIAAQNNYVNGTAIPRVWADYDWGFALPLRHSSVWLRSSAGTAFGDRLSPFANFFFGGFGNNWVDHGPEKRYREYYSFPGVGLDSIGGKNYAKTVLEWNLPPVRFRRAGTPGFYLSWARPSVFTSGLITNMDDASVRTTVRNAGTQLDLRFTVLSRLDMTLSGGYAVAFGNNLPKHDEAMISLKIMN